MAAELPNGRPAAAVRHPRRIVLIGASALAIVVLVIAKQWPRSNAALTSFPPPPAAPTAAVQMGDFAGSDICQECHAAQHSSWAGSTHARAGEAPPGTLLLRRFDGTAIRFRDAVVEPRASGSKLEFVVRWAGGTVHYPVAGVVGGAHMVGGGTQGFLWRRADGTMRLLPFELAGDDQAWFCNTGTRGKRGWVRITADMSIADCHDWPPTRVLGSAPRFVSCQQCHGSQILLIPDTAGYVTRFTSLSVECESCHGPGREHSERERTRPGSGASAMIPLATQSRDASVGVCMSCHALKVELRAGYLPGMDLEEYYSLKLPLLGSAEVHADGRTRTFAYQQGHYYSDCYVSGSMTCVDCHAPHDQRYRDITGRALTGWADDAQCTACHASKAQQPEHHTRHAAQSPGSRCVACHMPFVQQSAVGAEIRYTRADHTISIPRPTLDASLGVRNACISCHTDRSPAVVAADIRRLWGELKPVRPVIATLLDSTNVESLRRALLTADTTHRFAYFALLARHFAALDVADANTLPRRVRAHLWTLSRSADLDVAALALATLHLDRGRDAATRARLAERLHELAALDLSVRRRWAIALGHRADSYRAQLRHTDAVAVYAKALELLPAEPSILLALALAHIDSGDPLHAAELLQRLLSSDPRNALAWLHLGHVRSTARDDAGALDAYLRAAQLDAYDGAVQFHLGNALIRAGRAADAETAFRRAVELDPSLAAAHFNLARLLLLRNQHEAAIPVLRAGLIFDPRNDEAREVLEYLGTRRDTTRQPEP